MPYSFWNATRLAADAPPTYSGKQPAAIMGWGGIRIFSDSVDLRALCLQYAQAFAQASCGQCMPCSFGSRALAERLAVFGAGNAAQSDLDAIRSLADSIAQSSMCQIGQTTPLALIHVIDTFSAVLLEPVRPSDSTLKHDSVLTAPCMQACPIHLDIPRYVEEVKMGRFTKALDVICAKLPLPGVVGRVCTRPCESNCRRTLIDEPIQIKHLKRFVADQAHEADYTPAYTLAEKKALPVAVVGAGPAGVTCAHFLARQGYPVTIFETLPEPGGMAAVGIPDYRLPRAVLQREIAQIEKCGVTIQYNKTLGIDFTIEDLEQQGFKAVFLAMGCTVTKNSALRVRIKTTKDLFRESFFSALPISERRLRKGRNWLSSAAAMLRSIRPEWDSASDLKRYMLSIAAPVRKCRQIMLKCTMQSLKGCSSIS